MIPKKHLGQHFLRCKWVVSTLIHAAELQHEDIVLEIGPGEGGLTRALAHHSGQVIAVEKDEKLAQELKGSLKKGRISNVEIIAGDILVLLSTRLSLVDSTHNLLPATYKLIANIPYYLTSRLLRMLLEGEQKPQLIVLVLARRKFPAKPRLSKS